MDRTSAGCWNNRARRIVATTVSKTWPGRIFGIETEFGCLVLDDELGSAESVVDAIKDHIFLEQRLGLIDLHSRDEVFEPSHSGGFLMNGSRLYIDAVGSHLEYATAECLDLKSIIANDRAGHRIISHALEQMDLIGRVKLFNNSVDHFGGQTFGTHENYLVHMTEDFFTDRVPHLYSFLVTRQIFAGTGRVGGHILGEKDNLPTVGQIRQNPIDYIWVSAVYGVGLDDSIPFQLSQRADHILKPVASRVRFNRALINPKWEHFYSHNDQQRFHLLFGESNMMEFAYALKVGTTSLVLRLIEEGHSFPDQMLVDPIETLRSVSRDQSWKWPVETLTGEQETAIGIQRKFLEACQKYRGESAEIDWVLENWASTLDALENDPLKLYDRLDWVAKYKMLSEFRESEGLDWSDPYLHSLDMEYHNINAKEGLYYALQSMGDVQRITSELDVIDAMTDPPSNTRANARSQAIKKIMSGKKLIPYMIDWSGVAVGRSEYIDLEDPFNPSLPES